MEKLQPTYQGYIGDTTDAVIIMQAVLDEKLSPVNRRVNAKERPDTIVLGNVFVFIEESSKIKRWTDGTAWLASRILGRFLIYREVEKGDSSDVRGKKRRPSYPAAVGPDRAQNGSASSAFAPSSAPASHYGTRTNSVTNFSSDLPQNMASAYAETQIRNTIRRQEGQTRAAAEQKGANGPEAIDYKNGSVSFPAKLDPGLNKKTISLTIANFGQQKGATRTVHLISYFAPRDVVNRNLVRPSSSDLSSHRISPELSQAVEKALQNTKPMPPDMENFFLDSRCQLLRFNSPLKTPTQQRRLEASDRKTIRKEPDSKMVKKEPDSSPSEPPAAAAAAVVIPSVSDRLPAPFVESTTTHSSSLEVSNGYGVGITMPRYTFETTEQTGQSFYYSSSEPSKMPSREPKVPLEYSGLDSHANELISPESKSFNTSPHITQQNPRAGMALMAPLGQGFYPQMTYGDIHSPKTTSSSGAYGMFAYNAPTNLLNTYGAGRKEFDAQVMNNMGPKRIFPEYQVTNLLSPKRPLSPSAYEQPYPVNPYQKYTNEQCEWHDRFDIQPIINRRLESPLGFEFPHNLSRPRSRPEDLGGSHVFEDHFQ